MDFSGYWSSKLLSNSFSEENLSSLIVGLSEENPCSQFGDHNPIYICTRHVFPIQPIIELEIIQEYPHILTHTLLTDLAHYKLYGPPLIMIALDTQFNILLYLYKSINLTYFVEN